MNDPEIRRVRHETRRRRLNVASVADITPLMRRIVLASPELADFVSLSPDDNLKVMLPGGGDMIMRDYMPRAFDTKRQTLTIDFAIHDNAGPATAWAMNAKAGDRLTIGGLRGSSIIPDAFDWYLLAGDETALPAIGRRVEELRPGVPIITIAAVETDAERQTFVAKADWSGQWICRDKDGRDDAGALSAAIDRLAPKQADGFCWIASEAQVAKALKAHVLNRLSHPPRQLKAAGWCAAAWASISRSTEPLRFRRQASL